MSARLALAFVLVAACALAHAVAPSPRDELRLLVTVAMPPAAQAGGAGPAYRRPSAYSGSVALEATLDRIAREHALARVGGWTMRSLGVWCEVYEARDAEARERALAALARDEGVESAQPMRRFEAQAALGDPYHDLQPASVREELAAAHAIARGRGVRVAVIDSGVDATHADLEGAVAPRGDFVGGGERGAHGTEVAGVIAARAGNGVGIAGIAPEARLEDLRACWSEPGGATACNSYTLARALDAAIAARPAVINLSLAGPEDPLLARLLEAAEARGIVVVAAVPPGSASQDAFPARLPTVLAAIESERGDDGAIGAPGRDVLTTRPGDRYDFASGSSIAAAHVSGLAALYREAAPRATPAEVRAALRTWPATPMPALLRCAGHAAPCGG